MERTGRSICSTEIPIGIDQAGTKSARDLVVSLCISISYNAKKVKKKLAIICFVCYLIGMFKINDVVRVKYGTHKGKTFQVVGFAHKDSLGKLITCRLYRSQYRFNFMPWQIEIHPFFA